MADPVSGLCQGCGRPLAEPEAPAAPGRAAGIVVRRRRQLDEGGHEALDREGIEVDAGVADHLTIGAGAGIGAAASVFKDVPAGEVWTGFPARPLKRWMRETAWLARRAAGRTRGE